MRITTFARITLQQHHIRLILAVGFKFINDLLYYHFWMLLAIFIWFERICGIEFEFVGKGASI